MNPSPEEVLHYEAICSTVIFCVCCFGLLVLLLTWVLLVWKSNDPKAGEMWGGFAVFSFVVGLPLFIALVVAIVNSGSDWLKINYGQTKYLEKWYKENPPLRQEK